MDLLIQVLVIFFIYMCYSNAAETLRIPSQISGFVPRCSSLLFGTFSHNDYSNCSLSVFSDLSPPPREFAGIPLLELMMETLSKHWALDNQRAHKLNLSHLRKSHPSLPAINDLKTFTLGVLFFPGCYKQEARDSFYYPITLIVESHSTVFHSCVQWDLCHINFLKDYSKAVQKTISLSSGSNHLNWTTTSPHPHFYRGSGIYNTVNDSFICTMVLYHLYHQSAYFPPPIFQGIMSPL